MLPSASSDWDVAVRFHEFKTAYQADGLLVKRIREASAQAILRHARAILGSVTHASQIKRCVWTEVPTDAEGVELDLETTLEELSLAELLAHPWVSYRERRTEPMVLCVDTSLSMTGEKLALTAVALGVVLLQFPYDPIGIIAFETEPSVVKSPQELLNPKEVIERFLDVPAQGYTHLESGIRRALKQVREIRSLGIRRPAATVLLTDGKYTAGKDPAFLAPRFPRLIVLKMGTEHASLSLCRELSQKGGGYFHQVSDLAELPRAMMGAVKSVLTH